LKFERSTSAMVEAALVALIVTVLVLTIGYIPLVSYLMIFMPTMFSVVWIRRGRHYGILSVVVSSILSFTLGFPAEGFFTIAYGGLVAGFMSEGIRNNLKASQTILLGAVGAAFSSVLILSATELVTGIGLTQIFTEAIAETKVLFETAQFDPEMVTQLDEQMDLMILNMQNMLPFILIMSGLFMSSINHWAIRNGLRRVRYDVPPAGLFRDFELPRNVFLGSMIMMLLSWFTGVLGLSNSEILFLNVLMIVVLVFSIQGASVAIFFMYHYKFPRPAVVAMTVGIVLFYSVLQFPLFILGMLETIINLRGRMKLNA